MLFNSLVFFLFAGVFFALWPLMRGRNGTRWGLLTVASFIFYGWWDWRFLFLITATGLVNFFACLAQQRWPRHRRGIVVVAVVANLIPLATFKYLGFFTADVLGLLGLSLPGAVDWIREYIILPVGISFYTFQAMSYTIDVYRGELKPTRNVFHFFSYLAMFPQLVAGPIVRAKHLLPQLEHSAPVGEARRWEGCRLIVYGYFKKVVVADTIAPEVNNAFSAAHWVDSGAFWWLIMLLFAYQIYCDFSGYSDIARGLGRWMGYDFPVNFNHPYIARSFRDFWGRWHISLSTWFRDYVYIPLGGSRHGKWRSDVNMWITMLLSGLWHGAAWAFIIWGALHSAYLTLERWTKWPQRLQKIPVVGEHLTTLAIFGLTVIAWVFFRVGSCGHLSAGEQLLMAGRILGTMFNPAHFNGELAGDIDNAAVNVMLIMIARQLFFHFGLHEKEWGSLRQRRWAEPVFVAVLILVCVFMRGPGGAFIYFQF